MENKHLGPDASPLGRATHYPTHYAPDLLFPIARQGKRDEIGIAAGQELPFVGADFWNAYELSWLTPKGKPVVALGRFRVLADSPCLIESKSLKLYLNALNQTPFEGVDAVRATLTHDLSAAAGAPVEVTLAPLTDRPLRTLAYPEGVLLDTLDIAIDTYTLTPDFLTAEAGAAPVTETLYSHLLKSNCLVTGQPDWGMVVVRYTGAPLSRDGLLRYLVSFRQHNEFHEQCVERIFMDITHRCAPARLEVWARYTRRGGLDINPWRASHPGTEPRDEAEVRQ